MITAWEIAIKARLGNRVDLPSDVRGFVTDQIRRNRFTVLPVRLRDASGVHDLPGVHKDPFDACWRHRRDGSVPPLTRDERLRGYPVATRR